MLVNKARFALFFILLSCVSTPIHTARNHGASVTAVDEPAVESELQKEAQPEQEKQEARSSTMVKARIGSRPPSCINKCDSCTPCQAVQASQSLAEMSTNIGSRPPSCQNKCNRCIPCQAVQVPTPIQRTGKAPIPSFSPHRHHHQQQQQQQQQEVSVQYSNYKPEGWRCKCGNKLFNP